MSAVGLQAALAQTPPDHRAIPAFIRGADVSWLDHLERNGARFYEEGAEIDVLDAFRSHGVNTIRLRLWHTPTGSLAPNGLERTLAMAQRVKAAGLTLLLDVHYSDTWADPGRQTKPAAWQGLSFQSLADSVEAYTQYVLLRLLERDAMPDIIQVGNEITGGMLWNDGRVGGSFDTPAQWANLATLIQAALTGIDSAVPGGQERPAIMIHIDRGGDNAAATWFFDHLEAENVAFDLIGLSYYPWWHGALTRVPTNLRNLGRRYNKPMVIVETAYPWTLQWYDSTNNIVGLQSQVHDGYPASVDGQFRFLRDLRELITQVPGDLGKGLVYWEPAHIAIPGVGSPWENMALFDQNGGLLTSIQAFADTQTGREPTLEDTQKAGSLTSYPEPFRRSTTLSFTLGRRETVRIDVFDLTGRRMAIPLSQGVLPPGNHSVNLDASALTPGVYYVRLSIPSGTIGGKVVTRLR